jgi:hypothetical protein
MTFVFMMISVAKTLVTLSVKDKEKKAFQLEANPYASGTNLASALGEPDMKHRQLFHS